MNLSPADVNQEPANASAIEMKNHGDQLATDSQEALQATAPWLACKLSSHFGRLCPCMDQQDCAGEPLQMLFRLLSSSFPIPYYLLYLQLPFLLHFSHKPPLLSEIKNFLFKKTKQKNLQNYFCFYKLPRMINGQLEQMGKSYFVNVTEYKCVRNIHVCVST